MRFINFNQQEKQDNFQETKAAKASKTRLPRFWWLVLVVLVTVLVIGFFVIRVWINDIFETRQEIQERQDQLSNLIPKLKTLKEQDLDTLRSYFVRLDLAVPSSASPPLVMATVERALGEAGLETEQVLFQSIQEDETEIVEQNQNQDEEGAVKEVLGGQIQLQVSASGELFEIINFLKTISQVNPLVTAANFSIQEVPVNTREDADQVEYTQKLSYTALAPFHKVPETLGDIGAEIQPLDGDDTGLIDRLQSFKTYFEVTTDVDEIQGYPVGRSNPF